MKHITYTEKSLLVGDEAADLTLRYAVLLGNAGRADTIELHAYGADGDEFTATLLLNEGTPLIAETAHTSMNEPGNTDAIAYLTEHIALLEDPPHAQPADTAASEDYFDATLAD